MGYKLFVVLGQIFLILFLINNVSAIEKDEKGSSEIFVLITYNFNGQTQFEKIPLDYFSGSELLEISDTDSINIKFVCDYYDGDVIDLYTLKFDTFGNFWSDNSGVQFLADLDSFKNTKYLNQKFSYDGLKNKKQIYFYGNEFHTFTSNSYDLDFFMDYELKGTIFGGIFQKKTFKINKISFTKEYEYKLYGICKNPSQHIVAYNSEDNKEYAYTIFGKIQIS